MAAPYVGYEHGHFLDPDGAELAFPLSLLRLSHTTERVELYPGTAVVRGTMQGAIEMHGTAKTLNSRVLAVWVADDDGWTLVAFQPTPMPHSRGDSGANLRCSLHLPAVVSLIDCVLSGSGPVGCHVL